jgi:hypothetical protein
MLVLAGRAGLGFVLMTLDARGLARESQGFLTVDDESCGPKMAVLPECLWHHGIAHHKKYSDADEHHQHRAEQMAGVPEKPIHRGYSSLTAGIEQHGRVQEEYHRANRCFTRFLNFP